MNRFNHKHCAMSSIHSKYIVVKFIPKSIVKIKRLYNVGIMAIKKSIYFHIFFYFIYKNRNL